MYNKDVIILCKSYYHLGSVDMENNLNSNFEKKNKPNFFRKILSFLAKYGAPLTNLIILLNLIVFVFSSLDSSQLLLRYGASVNVLVYNGEMWRLLSSIFLHGGIAHLLLNMYSLYNLGNLTERIFGSTRFVFIYFVSGLFGNLVSTLLTSPNSQIFSVGASGAIFGLVGAILYLGMRSPQFFKKVAGTQFLIVVVANLVIGQMTPYIDNLAHIGGMVGGFLASWAIGLSKDIPDTTSKIIKVLLIIVTVACLCKIAFTQVPLPF